MCCLGKVEKVIQPNQPGRVVIENRFENFLIGSKTKKVLKRKERCEILKEKAAYKHLQQEWGRVLNGMFDDNFESQDEDISDESSNNNSLLRLVVA